MNDKDFDKIFSKKLKEEKASIADEKSWEALASQLNEHDRKKVSGGIKTRNLAWLLPLLLLLLSINVWSLLKMNQTKKQNLILGDELKALKKVLQKQDTLIQTQYIYKTDTVFIKSNNFKKADNNISLEQALPKTLSPINDYTSSPTVLQGFDVPSETTKPLTTADGSDFTSTNRVKSENKTSQQVENSLDLALNNSSKIGNKAIQQDDIENIKINENQVLLTTLPLLKGFVVNSLKPKPEIILLSLPISVPAPIIENRKINRFYFGVNSGFINYHTLWLNKDGLEVGRNEKSYQVGLKMEYALTNNWRVTAATDYCPYNFNIKWLDNRYNLPPTPNYYNPNTSTLNSIKGSQKLYLGSMGFKYVFNTNSRLRPYLATAYTAMRIEPYDAEYTFTHTATGKTYTNKTVLTKGADILNIALLNGGLEYRLQKHIVMQADAFYYKDINAVKKTYDLFGLRGAVLVGF
jgi:hypothetical protein